MVFKNEKYLEAVKSLRPIDGMLLRNIFKDSDRIVEKMLRTITKRPDLKVISTQFQTEMEELANNTGVCLDARAVDSKGVKYFLEIVNDSVEATPKRARYHESAMLIRYKKECMDDEFFYNYLIFITKNDYFGHNKDIYTSTCKEIITKTPVLDGLQIIYVNGQYRGDSEIGKLIHDLNCSNPDDMYDPMLAERTRYLKTNEVELKALCDQMARMKSIEKQKEKKHAHDNEK